MEHQPEDVAREVRKVRYTIVVIAASVCVAFFVRWRVQVAERERDEMANVDRMVKQIHDEANEAAIRAGLPTLEEDAARAAERSASSK